MRVTYTVTASYANNGTITLTVSEYAAPLHFLWNDGSTDQNRVALAAGDYFVTITDTPAHPPIPQSFYISIPDTFNLYLSKVQCCFQQKVSCVLGLESEGRYKEAMDLKTTAHIIWEILQILKCFSFNNPCDQCLTDSQAKILIDKLNQCGCPKYINQYIDSCLLQESGCLILQENSNRILI